ncbi:MAG: hypothetical protein ACE5D6_01780 [Candidatus Zixiibacteriota bacterium]
MRNIDRHRKYVAELSSQLSSEKIAMLDFDQMLQWLKEISIVIDEMELLQTEVKPLRRDYISRISGMAKAIAVVSRNQDRLKQVMNFIEKLPELSAEQLIEEYKTVQAKFQDAFPTSFGQLLRKTEPVKKMDFSSYK